jgi:glycosyltransferase 2 family protein
MTPDISKTNSDPEIILEKSENKTWGAAKTVLGYVIAIACLIWVFHDIHFDRLFSEIKNISWGLIILAVIFDILGYYMQGFRWQFLLKPLGQINSIKTTQAIYAGLFTNEIVPFRIGEFVRTYLVSRWLSISFWSVIPSLLVERFFDGIWLAIGVAITAMLVELPRNLVDAADILGVITISTIIIFVYLVFRKEKAISSRAATGKQHFRLAKIITSFLDRLANGIKSIGISRSFFASFFASALVLIFQMIAFWLVMKGYGLNLSIWVGAAVMLIVHLGTAIPNAPSNVGAYQFFCVVGLAIFGIDKTTATGFSVVVFIILTVPLWLLGFWAISRSGMTLKQIRNEISAIARKA